jgi:hypothetical protein
VTRVIHLSAVALLFAGVLRFYDTATGFTALISFGERYSASAVPALRDLPHRVSRRSEGYDGQFYAQMALDPLLRDPATDRAQDNPALRAAPNSLLVDCIHPRPRPARVDPPGICAAERAQLAGPRRAPAAMVQAGHPARDGVVARHRLLGRLALVDPARAARRSPAC